jgi:hypothetical protein
MVYIMGGRESQQFQRFIRLCCRAYNVVRSHAKVFTNLFAMVSHARTNASFRRMCSV